MSPDLCCPLGPRRGRPERQTSRAIRREVSRASIVTPDEPDRAVLADVAEERRRFRTTLAHDHRPYRPPVLISLGVLRRRSSLRKLAIAQVTNGAAGELCVIRDAPRRRSRGSIFSEST